MFIRKSLLLLFFHLVNLLYEIPSVQCAADFKLVCYYTNWAIYRPSLAKFTPQNINPYLCTHLIYAFAGLTRRFEVKPFDAYNDIQQGNYNKFIDLKKYNPDLKTMIAIGGWNEGSKKFSEMVSEDKNRKKFIKSVMKFLREHRFDGLDLDWEYPTFRDGSRPEDKEGYANLVQELREAFDNEPSSSGREKLLLTMAVPAGKQYIDQGYDVPILAKNLDFFNMLTYDFYTTAEGLANHHSALLGVSEYEDWDVHGQLNVDWTVNYYIELGVPPSKLVVGVPSYGRAFALEDAEEHELGSPIKGAAEAGAATREGGYLAYYEICQNIQDKDWEVHQPHPDAIGPYAFKDDQWVGYDDEAMVVRKARYVIEHKLGGLMFWSLDTDDFRGNCGEGNSPLINAARKTLFSKSKRKSSVIEDEKVEEEEEEEDEEPPPPPPKRTTPRPKRTTTTTTEAEVEEPVVEEEQVEENEEVVVTARPNARSDSSSFGSRNGNKGSRKTRRGNSRDDEDDAPATPEPPTTPDPGPQFECKDEGFFRNPNDCRKYFWCLDSGPADLGIVPHHFTCPSGLFFNTNSDSCDYKENVNCKLNPALGTTTTTRRPHSATTRAPKRKTTTRTTTTEAPEPEIEAEAETKPEGENVAQLLQLIKKLGGVEQVQKHLGIEAQGDVPSDEEAPTRSRVPSFRTKTPKSDAEDEETPAVASIAEEPPTPPRTRSSRRRTTTTTTPAAEEEEEVVTTRARRPATRATRRTTERSVEEEEVATTPRSTGRRLRGRTSRRSTTTPSDIEEDAIVDNSRQSTTVQKFQNVDQEEKVVRRTKVPATAGAENEKTTDVPHEEDGESHTFRQTRIPQLFRYINVNRNGSGNGEGTTEAVEEEEEQDITSKRSTDAKQLKSILDALDEPTTDSLSADQSAVVTSRNVHDETEVAHDEDAAAQHSINVASVAEQETAHADQETAHAEQEPALPFEDIGVHLEDRTDLPVAAEVTETNTEPEINTEPVVTEEETTPFYDYYPEDLTEEPELTTPPPTTTTTTTTTTEAPVTRRISLIRPKITTTTTTTTTTEAPTTTTRKALSPRTFRPTTATTTTSTVKPPIIRVKQIDDGAEVEEPFDGLTLDEEGNLECIEQGVYPHPIDCDKYVSCVHHQTVYTPYTYVCPSGQLYDEFTGRCLNADVVDCKATKK